VSVAASALPAAVAAAVGNYGSDDHYDFVLEHLVRGLSLRERVTLLHDWPSVLIVPSPLRLIPHSSDFNRRGAALSVALALLLAAGSCPPAGAAQPQPFASAIPEPTNLAFDTRDRLWVTSGGNVTQRSNGVWLIRRRGARPEQIIAGLYSALGLTWHQRRLYVSHVTPNRSSAASHLGRVTAFWGFDGRRFRRSRVVVDGLPTGLHRVNSLVPGVDRRLYLGVGSRFDNRTTPARLSGTVVSFKPGGGDLQVEATGLRNPYGLAFVPGTTTLLISDHGRDDLGLRRPHEEVNLVDVTGPAPDFGFPECFGQGGAACAGTQPPLAWLDPHAAPGAVAVVRTSPTAATAYVTEFGSSFDAQPTGGDVVALRLTRRGDRWSAVRRRFALGLGRQNPLGAVIGNDNALYVSLWRSQKIVRFPLPRRATPAASPAVVAPTPGLIDFLTWLLRVLGRG
jgi:glucose/arabinose dehydrogenase